MHNCRFSRVLQRTLDVLDILTGDGVQFFLAEQRNQVNPNDGIVRGDPARLVSIRTVVTVEEPRRKVS